MKTYAQQVEKQKEVEKKIEEWLDANGFQKGVNGYCRHKNGLPRTPNVLVRPSFCKEAGSRTLMITPKEIIEASVLEPYDQNIWNVKSTVEYASLDELKEQLTKLAYAELSFWGNKE